MKKSENVIKLDLLLKENRELQTSLKLKEAEEDSFLDDLPKRLYPDQEIALDELVSFLHDDHKIHVLTGYAGTGKTFIVDLFGKEAGQLGYYVYYTASTNKAARVLSEMGDGVMTSTIHSLLKLTLKFDYNTGKEVLVSNKKDYDNANDEDIEYPAVIVVDEGSMIGVDMMLTIAREATQGNEIKILYVLDDKQALPIGEDFPPVCSQDYPMSYLTEIKRQALGNPIITLATKFREGMDTNTLPVVESCFSESDSKQGVRVVDRATFNKMIVGAYTSDTYRREGVNFCRVIAWRNDVVIGYNRMVRDALGLDDLPQVGEKYVTNSTVVSTDIRDSRVLLKNESEVTIVSAEEQTMYGIDCYLIRIAELGEPLYMLKSLDQYKAVLNNLANEAKSFKAEGDSDKMRAKWREFYAVKKTVCDIRPQYAITSHKSQGSTYDVVFIDYGDLMLNRKTNEMLRLMYVALTRAKTQVIITW